MFLAIRAPLYSHFRTFPPFRSQDDALNISWFRFRSYRVDKHPNRHTNVQTHKWSLLKTVRPSLRGRCEVPPVPDKCLGTHSFKAGAAAASATDLWIFKFLWHLHSIRMRRHASGACLVQSLIGLVPIVTYIFTYLLFTQTLVYFRTVFIRWYFN